MAFIVGAFPLSCVTEGLAGVTTGENIHGLNLGPVDGGDVPEVGYAWVVGRHNCAGGWLNLGVPGQVAADGHVEAAVAAEQAADSHQQALIRLPMVRA